MTIAGSDCSAGAGIQADLKTFTAFGVYGLTALTSAVSEVPGRVARIASMSPTFLASQIRILTGHFPVDATKLGMIGSADLILATAKSLKEAQSERRFSGPIVADPVMVATSGDRLMQEDAISAYLEEIVPLCSLLTPNLDEGEVLLGAKIERDAHGISAAANKLAKNLGVPILLKGGHLKGNAADDVLAVPDGETSWFEGTRVPGVSTHGTGCTLSAAITAGLANGRDLVSAIAEAKMFVTGAINRFFHWSSGCGKPVDALNHFATGNESRGPAQPRRR